MLGRYGDECCGGRVSLLHFIVVFFMAGITALIVGAVQYKEEATLHDFRKYIVAVGCAIILAGARFRLSVVKCCRLSYCLL